jgi:hypothetical protein
MIIYRNENVKSTNNPPVILCFSHWNKFTKQRYTTRHFAVPHMYKYTILLFELAVGITMYALLSSDHFKAILAQLKWGTVSETYWSLKYKYFCWWAISNFGIKHCVSINFFPDVSGQLSSKSLKLVNVEENFRHFKTNPLLCLIRSGTNYIAMRRHILEVKLCMPLVLPGIDGFNRKKE